jgi:hypothetical protein
MFQPRAKLEFVERYCNPAKGWKVRVDIDASEEGRTGGVRTTDEGRRRQVRMKDDAKVVRRRFAEIDMGVGRIKQWCSLHDLPYVATDPDILAYRKENGACIIAEVEADSAGQPEQKLYKAIGQIVRAASCPTNDKWTRHLVIVVYGQRIAEHLRHMTALKEFGIFALSIANDAADDHWPFGRIPGLQS